MPPEAGVREARRAERAARHDARAARAAEDGLLLDPPPLPPLLRGARRRWMAALIGLGVLQAGLAGLSAWALVQLQAAPAGLGPVLLRALLVLVLAALAVGGLTVQQRVLAERLGQDYVHELRLRLVADALAPGHRTALGVTVARTTNDLTAVRSWVSQGIAPLAVGLPLIAGGVLTLAVLHPLLAATAAVVLALFALLLGLVARRALVSTRALRRSRGRMAARIAETVTAAEAIRAAGGGDRELRGLRESSDAVVSRAVHRAEAVGALRAAGIVAATLLTLLVAAAGTALALGPGITVAAMAVAGMTSTPVLEMGRIVEYRQNQRAARMVLGPALDAADERRRTAERAREDSARALPPSGLPARGVHVELPGITADGRPLRALPGERVHLTSSDPAAPSALLRRLLAPGTTAEGEHRPDAVWVDGENLRALAPRRVRELVGLAAAGTVFERGSLARALHYRRPDLDGAHDQEVLRAVGLDADALPRGTRTRLRGGGDPLGRADRARLALARALYGTPPLLLVDGLEGDLDDAGRERLAELLRRYPGVVLLVGGASLAARIGAREHRLPGTSDGPVGPARPRTAADHQEDDDD